MGVTAPVMAGDKDTRMKSEEEKPLLRVSGKGADCKYLISSLQIWIFDTLYAVFWRPSRSERHATVRRESC